MTATRARSRLLALLAAATGLALAACSGGTSAGGPGGSLGESLSSAAPRTAEAPADPAVPDPPRTSPPLPDGDLQVVARVRMAPGASFQGFTTVLHDEDRFYLLTPSDVLVAVDRTTGAVAWRTPLSFEGDDACPPTALPPGATVVVVYGGGLCSERRVLDPATGEVVDDTPLPDVSDQVQVGPWTYVVDRAGVVSRVEADGSVSEVARTPDLEVLETRIGEVLGAADSDLLTVGIDTFGPATDDDGARYVGFEVSDDGSPATQVFDVARPDSLGDVDLDRTIPAAERGLPGLLISPLAGGTTLQLAGLDPDTGRADRRVEVGPRTAGGTPDWAGYPDPDAALAAGDQVYSASSPRRGDADAITRYDLDSGEVAWSWTAPRTDEAVLRTTAFPVGVTDDGAHLYVSVTASLDPSLLVELDTETGTETRRWVLPERAGAFSAAGYAIVDDQVLVYDARFGDGSGSRDLAALLTLG